MDDTPDFGRLRQTLLLEGEPDRVPLAEVGVEKEVMSAFLEKPVNDLATEVEFWIKAGYDYVPISIGIRPVLQLRIRYQYREGRETPILVKGRPAKAHYSLYTEDLSEREWSEEGEGVIRTLDDFERFPWPEVDSFDCAIFEDVKQYLPPGMKTIPVIGGIISGAQWLMGFEAFCLAFAENPELIERLFQKLTGLNYGLVQKLVTFDAVGAIWEGGDMAYTEGLMFSPKHLRKHVFPCYKGIGDLCRDAGLPYIFHSDGRIYEVIDDLIACGVRALHPIEPKAMDINLLKEKYGERLCLCGNIDLAYTLTLGTPEEVEAEVRERIRNVAPGGGYCIGSSNSITEYVPLVNYNAMREAAFKYGRYPMTA